MVFISNLEINIAMTVLISCIAKNRPGLLWAFHWRTCWVGIWGFRVVPNMMSEPEMEIIYWRSRGLMFCSIPFLFTQFMKSESIKLVRIIIDVLIKLKWNGWSTDPCSWRDGDTITESKRFHNMTLTGHCYELQEMKGHLCLRGASVYSLWWMNQVLRV